MAYCLDIEREPLNSPLMRYAVNIASQTGEDGIIERIVELIAPPKICVEFGAWDGKHFSNCFNLIKNHGWGGLMIEAHPERFTKLLGTYAGNPSVACSDRYVHFAGADRLDAVLAEAESIPKDFGLLSIDIDGNDYHVWDSLVDYTPEIVVIEMNPCVPNDVIFVQDKSFAVNQGCSLLALIKLGKQKGYELAAATIYNGIFVRKDKYPLLGIADNSINKLFKPEQDGRIFPNPDGYIHVVGMNRLYWRSGDVSSEDFQVVPASERGWEDARKEGEQSSRGQ